jgi:hypothetical protein
MGIGMVPNRVPLSQGAAHSVREALSVLPTDKEGGGYLFIAKNVEDLLG